MNRDKLSSILLVILLVPVVFLITLSLFTSGGNQISQFFQWLLVIGAAIGFIAPRFAMFLFLGFQFYFDFFKRLLVIGDSLSMQDIMISLGLGPILVVSACCSCVIMWISGKLDFSTKLDWVYFFGCVAISVSGFFLVRDVDFVERGQSMMGTSMLGMTAFACYVIFREEDDAFRLFRWIVITAIPVALYTFWQVSFGIAAWEERYIQTGLSKVLYSFYLLDGINGMRPFSTMNTHTSLGAVGGTLFLICFLIMTRSKKIFPVTRSSPVSYVLLSLLFLATCLLARNRTTYLLPVAGIALVWFFSGGLRTILFYILGIATVVLVIYHAEWINDHIIEWSIAFEQTSFGAKFGTLGTYQARLESFIRFQDPQNWTPFGLPPELRPFTHDMLTQALVSVGYIPLTVGLLVLGYFVTWWHRACLKVQEPKARRFLILLSAVTISLGICGFAYGNLLFVAPVNSLTGVLIAMGLVAIRRSRSMQAVSQANPQGIPSSLPTGPPVMHAGK